MATAGTYRRTPQLPEGSNGFRMLIGMAGLHNAVKGSLVGRTFSRLLRFGALRGLRSIEIDPEDFRRHLANKHGLWVPTFARMKDVPTERLDAIAAVLIRDAERLALALDLLADPAYDALLEPATIFEDLPRAMPTLLGGGLCHIVTYGTNACSA